MADYFTNFSLVLKLSDEQKQYALDIAKKAAEHKFHDGDLDGFPTSLTDAIENWSFETEADDEKLWLHSDSGGVDAACAFIQHLLQKFEFDAFVAFEWSHDCNKPRTDAYGGGAAFITSTEIGTFSTADWLRSKTP